MTYLMANQGMWRTFSFFKDIFRDVNLNSLLEATSPYRNHFSCLGRRCADHVCSIWPERGMKSKQLLIFPSYRSSCHLKSMLMKSHVFGRRTKLKSLNIWPLGISLDYENVHIHMQAKRSSGIFNDIGTNVRKL